MTEAEWLACTEPQKMLEFLRGKISDRKLRLFAVACCGRIWHLLQDERSQNAVDVAEAFADGRATTSELGTAQLVANQSRHAGDDAAEAAATCAERYDPTPAPEVWKYEEFYEGFHGAIGTACNAACAVAGRNSTGEPAHDIESRQQSSLLRCTLGNPFRPVILNPTWLTPTVTGLAETIYQERAFDRMPILADALEDAGCTNADILNHCRQPGEHVRGCWAIDLLTGRS